MPFIIKAILKKIADSPLFAYWPFNGNANDESGNGHNGSVDGATLTTDRDSNPNSAYLFDGTDDSIDFGDMNLNELVGNNFSMAFWVKFDNLAHLGVIVQATTSGDSVNILTVSQESDGKFRIHLDNYFSDSNIVINANEVDWFFFVITLSRDDLNVVDIELFKDAVSIYTATDSNSVLFPPSDHFVMGALSSLSARFFEGKLDDIRLFNKVLSQAEITALFTE